MQILIARNVYSSGGLIAYKAKERGVLNNIYELYIDVNSLSQAIGLSLRQCKEALELVCKESLALIYLENDVRVTAILLNDMNMFYSCFAGRIDPMLLGVLKAKVRGLTDEIHIERGNRK